MRSGDPDSSPSLLQRAVEAAAHRLPAQGPIHVFIHHNPLHAFEDLPFEDAVAVAGQLFGCQPFLEEARYRDAVKTGRIARDDVVTELRDALGEGAETPLIPGVSRLYLGRVVLIHGIPRASGAPLRWLLSETDALQAFRKDLPVAARVALTPEEGPWGPSDDEAVLVRGIWEACVAAVGRTPAPPAAKVEGERPLRPRDACLAARGVDVDEWIHPVLIRVTGAFLDQGIGHLPMPGRERGLYHAFLDLYSRPLSRAVGPWGGCLVDVLTAERASHMDGWSSLEASLIALGVPEARWGEALVAEALALRGWAGMVRQLEERPDRAPATPLPAHLHDFLAVRLLLTRAALAWAERAPPPAVPPGAASGGAAEADDRALRRAWHLFHVAQLLGLDQAAVDGLSPQEIAGVEAELAALSDLRRRRILHRAYERNLRTRLYDALLQAERPAPPLAPSLQVLSCIDDREESWRRHLEEASPQVETYGTAGFFGVAMYYQGLSDPRPRPSCPVAVQPRHFVREGAAEGAPPPGSGPLSRPHLAAEVGRSLLLGSRTLSRGALITATIGALWLIPLILRVLWPWSRRLPDLSPAPPEGPLLLERAEAIPPVGDHTGYTLAEQADVVAGQLIPLGILSRLAPLVLVLGHASESLNNPHRGAYECGACGGGQGGPNARAFAAMANDPRVRALLAERGVDLPEGTWFIGGERNTASGDVTFFDEALAPPSHRGALDLARGIIDAARASEAHERCRRFKSASPHLSPSAALHHTQARAADLAQPRPEYGHATNAFCIVGRRALTRGLFLDRRAFLTSYDPTVDPDGAILGRLLKAVVPVVVGINLEYFFGRIDPTGYGSGTKLPHNVSGLLGVMDGAASDLRTGLHWQTLEIHEPVRLTMVVEATVATTQALVAADANLKRLVENRWMTLASIDPARGDLHEILSATAAIPIPPRHPLGKVSGPSVSHYQGKRFHLPFVRVGAEGAAP